jgi:hypothetical protein
VPTGRGRGGLADPTLLVDEGDDRHTTVTSAASIRQEVRTRACRRLDLKISVISIGYYSFEVNLNLIMTDRRCAPGN